LTAKDKLEGKPNELIYIDVNNKEFLKTYGNGKCKY
jgi:hypothetical protein